MKKNYTKPILTIALFEAQNTIMVSGQIGDENPDGAAKTYGWSQIIWG